jgi:hypothetical protein
MDQHIEAPSGYKSQICQKNNYMKKHNGCKKQTGKVEWQDMDIQQFKVYANSL